MIHVRLAPRDDDFYFASPHPDGLAAALGVRDQGGNAVDAAVAAAASLSVCYPHMTGLGGDLFAIVGTPSDGVWVINGSGRAPLLADREALYKRHGDHLPRWSPATVTVPGAVMAWHDLLHRFGNTDLTTAVSHATSLATMGISVAAHLAGALQEDAHRLTQDPALQNIFYQAHRAPKAGDRIVQLELASTLREISKSGVDPMYRGNIAESLVAFLNGQGSPLSMRDMSAHRSTWSRPIELRYDGYRLCTTPPNSQGSTLLTIMSEIERHGLVPDHLGNDAAVMAEIFKNATIDRDGSLGDPALPQAMSDAFIGPDVHPGTISPSFRPSADTVGVVAADGEGWWISLNQSLFDSFGAGIADPETGVVLHNRGAGFSLREGQPNTMRPGVRPPHTLMPTLVLSDRAPVAAIATMGGGAHPQIQAEVLMSLIRTRDARVAVRQPRWLVGGTSGDDYSICVAEPTIPPLVRSLLASHFHSIIDPTESNGVGHAQLIALFDDCYLSAADFRSDGCSFPEL